MKALDGDYIDRSYRVFNIGAANDVPAYGSEIAFAMNNYLEAVDHILDLTGRQAVGQAYLNAPFSMRFVKASPAHLSMMEGADTCMVEFISLDHTIGGKELLQELETEMYAFGGRPHWGLLNFLSGRDGLIEAMYPLLALWQVVRRELDPHGRFANAFTERCGLTLRVFLTGQVGRGEIMSSDPQAQIMEAEERLRQAMLHSDVDTLDELIAPELYFTDHFGRVVRKEDDLAIHRSGVLQLKNTQAYAAVYPDPGGICGCFGLDAPARQL